MNIDIHKVTLGMIKRTLCDQKDKMRLGFLSGDRELDNMRVYDVLIPRQRRRPCDVSVSDKAHIKIIYEMCATNTVCVGVAIYQPGFKPFISGTNRALMKELVSLAELPMICLICNEKGKHRFFIEDEK